ncbi:MAG TPA: 50S ribosomal protein L29 [Kiritimatiellia bacterium]|jgi:large subunit ribosomal protein L29|nr:50S ribosomal protein L29 [Kiritimatiellia bacterium]HPJ56098.1 50S ribosomal protein L29 [Kiritimatiellia bacterium]HPR68179.1 50S ribosomal protein L29 [Kiritimatiellia bacterium]HRX06024.1 50S ribosomal protein L29 [Kiritimatiellia bacterium]
MKAKEVRDWTAEEQAQKLAEAEKELFNLRIQQAAGQLEKPDRLRTVRRDIARIKTVMNTAKAAR